MHNQNRVLSSVILLGFVAVGVSSSQVPRHIHHQSRWDLLRRPLMEGAGSLVVTVPVGFGVSRSVFSWGVNPTESRISVGVAETSNQGLVIPVVTVRPLPPSRIVQDVGRVDILGDVSAADKIVIHVQIRRGTALVLKEGSEVIGSISAASDGIVQGGRPETIDKVTEMFAVGRLITPGLPDREESPRLGADGLFRVNAASLAAHGANQLRTRYVGGGPRFELLRIEVSKDGSIGKVSCVRGGCDLLPLVETEIRSLKVRPFELDGKIVDVQSDVPLAVGPDGQLTTPLLRSAP